MLQGREGDGVGVVQTHGVAPWQRLNWKMVTSPEFIVNVNASLESVEAAAMQLSAQERAELIERLIDTVLPHPPLHPAWEAEIARRVADMDAGLTESIPAEKVFADMRALIESHDHKA